MKVIFINAAEKKIEALEIEQGSNDAIYKTLGYRTELMEQVTMLHNDDVLMVDEEGTFEGHSETPDGTRFGFLFMKMQMPIHGNGLIFGVDYDGESVDAKSTIEDIKSVVKFIRS